MLSQRRAELDRLVAALLEHETLERDELAVILGPRRDAERRLQRRCLGKPASPKWNPTSAMPPNAPKVAN